MKNTLAPLLIVLAMLLLLLSGRPAPAQSVDMLAFYDTAPAKVDRASPSCCKRKPRTVKRRRVHKSTPARVYAAEYRAPDNGARCFDPVTVVGSQWVGEDGAYESAVKAAKELIRWKVGEAAMDPANWKDVKRRCSLSSVGEIAGQVFHRCELTATPCRPGLTEGTVP